MAENILQKNICTNRDGQQRGFGESQSINKAKNI